MGNPAWDFGYFQRGYEVNREFCFRARAVPRKFQGVEDVIRLYERGSGETAILHNDAVGEWGGAVARGGMARAPTGGSAGLQRYLLALEPGN
jgi:hypothetical protein